VLSAAFCCIVLVTYLRVMQSYSSLQEFIKEGVEWAHLDIAGPVWDEKAALPTGYGAALLAQWATNQGRT
jgi:leucyl aminopeptidase